MNQDYRVVGIIDEDQAKVITGVANHTTKPPEEIVACLIEIGLGALGAIHKGKLPELMEFLNRADMLNDMALVLGQVKDAITAEESGSVA